MNTFLRMMAEYGFVEGMFELGPEEVPDEMRHVFDKLYYLQTEIECFLKDNYSEEELEEYEIFI